MDITLKKLKVHDDMSEETTCYSAELWVDGAFAADARNDGQGGSDRYRFVSPEVEARVEAFCAALPPSRLVEGEPMDLELFVIELLTRYDVKKLCKRQTLFRLHSGTYAPGEWIAMKTKFSPAVHASLTAEYGQDLAEIANAMDLPSL